MSVKKQCRRCGEVKDRDQFRRRASVKDGLQSYCKKCGNRVVAEGRKADKRETMK